MKINSVKCDKCGKIFKGNDCMSQCEEHEKIPVDECKLKIGDTVLIMYRGVKKERMTPRNQFSIYFEIEEVKELQVNNEHGWNFNRLHRFDDCCYIINSMDDVRSALNRYDFQIHKLVKGE